MPRQGKRTKPAPNRVWVLLEAGVPGLVGLDPEEFEPLGDDEVVYRYDLHKEKK